MQESMFSLFKKKKKAVIGKSYLPQSRATEAGVWAIKIASPGFFSSTVIRCLTHMWHAGPGENAFCNTPWLQRKSDCKMGKAMKWMAMHGAGIVTPRRELYWKQGDTEAVTSERASGLLPPSSLWESGNQTCWDNKTPHSISFCIGKLKPFSMKENNEQIKGWPVRNRMEIQDTYHTDEVSLCKLSLYFAVMSWPAA